MSFSMFPAPTLDSPRAEAATESRIARRRRVLPIIVLQLDSPSTNGTQNEGVARLALVMVLNRGISGHFVHPGE